MMNQVQSNQLNLTPHLDPVPIQVWQILISNRKWNVSLLNLNLGDVHLEKEDKARFIDLIYSNQEVFSLHDEDLGYCNKLTHTIPTSTNKPVYLPHRTIPRQLQGEVCKCLNTWLCQGIIRPSNSPCASQVVFVWKKTGEIPICVDYRKLNSNTIRDGFPLPHIDEALQAVHNCNVFTSFDLAQGYLQLAMAEDNIKKTTFRAGFSGLYEFTCMPFGLSNAGSSFCRLMEQCQVISSLSPCCCI